MTNTLLASQQVLAASSGVQSVGYVVGLVILVFMVVDVWRSNATVGKKIVWTIFSVLCGIVALIVWLVWGKKNANQGAR
ncbi:hypothetical protein BH10ACT8_BH10ACT8_21080 [soil metagenome]